MVKIYLVRHCETVGNVANIFQGYTDCDVSELGVKQLACLKQRFENVQLDKVYSSPLIRAVKTAEAAVGDRDIEVIKDKDFIEVYCGSIEGETFTSIFENHPDLKDTWYNAPHLFAPEGAEPMWEVYDRVWRGLEKIIQDPDNDGKTILIASHGAALRCALCKIMFDSVERLIDAPWSKNTAVTLLLCDKDKIEIEYHNDFSHLPEEYISKRKAYAV